MSYSRTCRARLDHQETLCPGAGADHCLEAGGRPGSQDITVELVRQGDPSRGNSKDAEGREGTVAEMEGWAREEMDKASKGGGNAKWVLRLARGLTGHGELLSTSMQETT